MSPTSKFNSNSSKNSPLPLIFLASSLAAIALYYSSFKSDSTLQDFLRQKLTGNQRVCVFRLPHVFGAFFLHGWPAPRDDDARRRRRRDGHDEDVLPRGVQGGETEKTLDFPFFFFKKNMLKQVNQQELTYHAKKLMLDPEV